MPFIAQYAGQCSKCEGPIKIGESINGSKVSGEYWHWSCPTPESEKADASALAAGRCPVCQLHHPGEC